jgi:tetratricopeptide (TPR) repeat protein
MKCWKLIPPLLILLIFSTAEIAGASRPLQQLPALKVRMGKHPSFIRYVFEGPDSIISGIKVRQDGGNIVLDFPVKGLRLAGSVSLRYENDRVVIAGRGGGIKKVFSLDNPDRLVVDIERKEKKDTKDSGADMKVAKSHERKPGDKKETVSEASGKKEDTPQQDTSSVLHVPEKYRKVWTLLKSGNPYGVLSVLPEYPPSGRDEVAFYHFIYGSAAAGAGQYMKSVEHLRLAYVLTSDQSLRERALIKRAEVRLEGGFDYEAIADYKLFLKEFPSSTRIEKAHLGLARCFMNIGRYSEAVRHFDMVPQSVEVLYSKANAYQRIEKVRSASRVYKRALEKAPDYPDRHPETAYLLGENLRSRGKYTEAKKRFLGIITGRYKDEARISMGLIAIEEGDFDEAIRVLQTAVMSKDRKVKVKALFNLSVAYARDGKIDKAIETLEEIRTRHIDSFYYRDSLLALAKLYRRTGKIDRVVPLLKELVYGKQPPAQAFRELEDIVAEMARKEDDETNGGLTFRRLWKEVGQWLVDRSRERFLLQVARRLRHEGSPFIELAQWMIENTSPVIKTETAVLLADYYIEIGDEELAEKYITFTAAPFPPSDMARRVKSRIFFAKARYEKAVKEIARIKEFRKDDMGMLLRIIREVRKPGSKLMDRAIELYEKRLKKGDWGADEYIGLADILYSIDRRDRALKYIRMAYQKNPDDEWVMYRMAHDVEKNRAREMFAALGSGNSLLSRLARTRIMEMNLLNRVSEVY